MARKKSDPPVNDGITHTIDPFTQGLIDKLNAAEELIAAQDDLLVCYRLQKSRVRAIDRVSAAKKNWESLND